MRIRTSQTLSGRIVGWWRLELGYCPRCRFSDPSCPICSSWKRGSILTEEIREQWLDLFLSLDEKKPEPVVVSASAPSLQDSCTPCPLPTETPCPSPLPTGPALRPPVRPPAIHTPIGPVGTIKAVCKKKMFASCGSPSPQSCNVCGDGPCPFPTITETTVNTSPTPETPPLSEAPATPENPSTSGSSPNPSSLSSESPGEGWRVLEKGELTQEGDQFFCALPNRKVGDDIASFNGSVKIAVSFGKQVGIWMDSSNYMLPDPDRGRQAVHLIYRRKINPPVPVVSASEPGEGWRLLSPDEPVQKGDQLFIHYPLRPGSKVFTLDGTSSTVVLFEGKPGSWMDSSNHMLPGSCKGKQTEGYVYRRRIQEPSSRPGTPQGIQIGTSPPNQTPDLVSHLKDRIQKMAGTPTPDQAIPINAIFQSRFTTTATPLPDFIIPKPGSSLPQLETFTTETQFALSPKQISLPSSEPWRDLPLPKGYVWQDKVPPRSCDWFSYAHPDYTRRNWDSTNLESWARAKKLTWYPEEILGYNSPHPLLIICRSEDYPS